jgi:hypothetical protein
MLEGSFNLIITLVTYKLLKKKIFHPNLTTSTKDDPPPLKECLVEKKLVVHVHIMGHEAII